MKHALKLITLSTLLVGCSTNEITTTEHDGFNVIEQTKGPSLGHSPASGVSIMEKDGFAFKDLNKNGELDVYEDWRKSPKERAEDLAKQMTIEQIAGLMLYSDHQRVPSEEITDTQKKFLKEDNLRAILFTTVKDAETAAKWSNNVQAYVESIGLGIPANNSSDPRHQASSTMEFEAGGGGDISRWPSPLGMAATFDPQLWRNSDTLPPSSTGRSVSLPPCRHRSTSRQSHAGGDIAAHTESLSFSLPTSHVHTVMASRHLRRRRPSTVHGDMRA